VLASYPNELLVIVDKTVDDSAKFKVYHLMKLQGMSLTVFRIFQSNQIKSKSNPFFNPDFGADLKFLKCGGFDLDLI